MVPYALLKELYAASWKIIKQKKVFESLLFCKVLLALTFYLTPHNFWNK